MPRSTAKPLSLALSISVLMTAGCGSSSRNNNQSSSLRIVQANSGQAISAILLDGNVVSNNLAFMSNTGYLSVKAGTHQVGLQNSGPPLITSSVNVSSTSHETFVIGGWGDYTLCCGSNSWFADDTTPVSSKVKLRIWDAADTSFGVDVYVLPPGGTPHGTPTASALNLSDASPDVLISPGTYAIIFTEEGTTSVVYQTVPITFSANQNRTLVLATNCPATSCDFTTPTLTSLMLADLN